MEKSVILCFKVPLQGNNNTRRISCKNLHLAAGKKRVIKYSHIPLLKGNALTYLKLGSSFKEQASSISDYILCSKPVLSSIPCKHISYTFQKIISLNSEIFINIYISFSFNYYTSRSEIEVSEKKVILEENTFLTFHFN